MKSSRPSPVFILLLTTFVILTSAPVKSSEYVITQITNTSYADQSPQINNIGQMVWYGYEGILIRHRLYASPGDFFIL